MSKAYNRSDIVPALKHSTARYLAVLLVDCIARCRAAASIFSRTCAKQSRVAKMHRRSCSLRQPITRIGQQLGHLHSVVHEARNYRSARTGLSDARTKSRFHFCRLSPTLHLSLLAKQKAESPHSSAALLSWHSDCEAAKKPCPSMSKDILAAACSEQGARFLQVAATPSSQTVCWPHCRHQPVRLCVRIGPLGPT